MQVQSLSGFLRSTVGKWAVIFLLLTIIGLAATIQSSIVMIQKQQFEIAYSNNLFFNLFYWWFWLAVIPVITYLSNKFDFGKGRLTLSIATHISSMLLIVFIHQLYTSVWCNYIFGNYLYMPLFQKLIWRVVNLEWIFVDFVVYFIFVVGLFALEYQRRSNENERIILQLETKLAQAQLHALKMQLHPHFLFNTMNSISTLILKGEIQKANKMLVMFSEFLRITLEETGSQKVPLEKELLFIEKYLEVEKIRFQDKLTVNMNIHPSTLSIMVPNLILQPLIENAVKYAIAPKTSDGLISISSSIRKNSLMISIQDNGPGLNDVSLENLNGGIGLKNTKERLQKLYGDEASINLNNTGNGGLLITLQIPFDKTDNTGDNLFIENNIVPAYQS
ncbi:MAG: histidine kinase [Ignavibacteriaceae bacterium]